MKTFLSIAILIATAFIFFASPAAAQQIAWGDWQTSYLYKDTSVKMTDTVGYQYRIGVVNDSIRIIEAKINGSKKGWTFGSIQKPYDAKKLADPKQPVLIQRLNEAGVTFIDRTPGSMKITHPDWNAKLGDILDAIQTSAFSSIKNRDDHGDGAF